MKPKMFVGYVEQPGIVDVQYMAQNIVRKSARGVIVYQKPPADNVVDMAKQRGVPLFQAENLTKKVKELESRYKAEGFSVNVKDLTEVRNIMRDVC